MSSLASIVLAGGRGRRLSSVTGGVPKQFWAPQGRPSLLEETLARIAPLSDSNRTFTVVDSSHGPYVETLQRRGMNAQVVYQPADRGTAAGVLLGTTLLASADRDAVALVTPSDHGVARPEEFRAGVRAAVAHVRAHPTAVILLGVQASSPVGDYGWIVPARRVGRGVAPVASFVEKPLPAAAERLFSSGAIWNTMVLVARADALLDVYRRHAPDLTTAFDRLRFLGPAMRDAHIGRIYEHLPSVDFSQDVLARATGLQCMAWSSAMGWTDLGTPERLAAWLTRSWPEDPHRLTAPAGTRLVERADRSALPDVDARRLA